MNFLPLFFRGVSAISFSRSGSCVYTAGSDGMVCQIDPLTGNLLGKFKASTKGISYMSVSPGTCLHNFSATLVLY